LVQAYEAARNALKFILQATPGERAAVIFDAEKEEIAEAFTKAAVHEQLWTRAIVLENARALRRELPSRVLEILSSENPEICINLLRDMAEETPFRIQLINLETRKRRSRLGHCPGITLDMLTKGALALSAAEHLKMQSYADKIVATMNRSIEVRVTSPSGTDLTFSTRGREFWSDTKIDLQKPRWTNLPTGEVAVAPVENSLEGTLICDKVVGGIGITRDLVQIVARKGKIQKIDSADKPLRTRVIKALNTDAWASTVGEFAIGVNSKARFTTHFLETEKIKGSAHVAFGHNLDFPGGKNPSATHMDFFISKPSVEIRFGDRSSEPVLKNGKLRI